MLRCYFFVFSETPVPFGHDAADNVLAGHHACPAFRVEREPEVVPRERTHLPCQNEQVGVDGLQPRHHLVGDVVAFGGTQQVHLVLPVLAVRAAHIIASRCHELFHERVERSHLCGGIRQLVRHQCGDGSSFQVAAHRFQKQVAVPGDFRRHQFPCTFDLVQVLYRTLGVGKVFQHLVLYIMYPVEGHCYSGLCRNDFLLPFLALLVDAF